MLMCNQLITFKIILILQFGFKMVVSDCPSQGCVNCSTAVYGSWEERAMVDS